MNARLLHSPAAVLFFADCAALIVSCIVAFFLRYVTTSQPLDPALYTATLPWLVVFPLLYLMSGLYPGAFLRRQEELKRLCIATSAGFMALAFFSFLMKEGTSYSRLALLFAWLFTVISLPLARYLTRRHFCSRRWWLKPCVMFGSAGRIPPLCAALAGSAMRGVRPAVLVLGEGEATPDLGENANAVTVARVPLADPKAAREALAIIAANYPDAYAVASFGAADVDTHRNWLNAIDHCFQRIIFIPDIAVGGRVWDMAVSIGDLTGLMLRQNLLDPRRMLVKRILDLVATLSVGVLIFPLLFLLSLAVRLDSPGPVFFRQRRIGRGGKPFMVYKFRTMAADAAERLARHLANDPAAAAEWAETQKLKSDPRVTRVGSFLRKTSLDELPQLINVLLGEMSLVGPRPIVDDEIARYGDDYALYTRVRPGITGLWQVSGRNDLSYAERVRLDHHYVSNWSVWLDILIIIRTIPEVLRCSGAY